MTKNALIANKSFYKGKRVFITGQTGFKGAWLTAVLYELGAQVRGFALAPASGCLFEKMKGEELIDSVIGDVRDAKSFQKALCDFQPEIVIHLAAQAIVNDCFNDPVFAYGTNVMGTVNLLEAVRACSSVKSVVIITTDKVYENRGDGAVYKETDPLGGIDPYSSSKTCMEYVTKAYRYSYLQTEDRMVGVSTVRASNVLGGGDHVQSRLIPSILNSFREGKNVELRHPHQTRPWQSVLDALNGYLTIGRLMALEPRKYSDGWNIGPTKDGIKDVLWVVQKMQAFYENATDYQVGNAFSVTESQTLGLDIEKSLKELDWEPEMSCDDLFLNIVNYFKDQLAGVPEREICLGQVKQFYKI